MFIKEMCKSIEFFIKDIHSLDGPWFPYSLSVLPSDDEPSF